MVYGNRAMPKWLKIIVAVVFVPALGYFLLVVLTPTFGKVVGYANEQPPLRLVQPANPSPSRIVRLILRHAETQFATIEGAEDLYWPEPSKLTEYETCWLIEFTRKVPIYRLLGFRQVVRPTDRAMYMSVDKAEMTMRFGKYCEAE